MLGGRKTPQANGQTQEAAGNGNGHSITLLTIVERKRHKGPYW